MKKITRRAVIVALGISGLYLILNLFLTNNLAIAALLGLGYYIWRAHLEN